MYSSSVLFIFFCVSSTVTCYHQGPTLQCRENEEVSCVNECPPERSCRNRDIVFDCAQQGPCKMKCVCKKGYYRNSIGECITKAQCKQCSKPNEYYSCRGACDNECAKLRYQNQTNCPVVNIKCNEMCYCDPGHARDAAGNCIPIAQCPPESNKGSCGKYSQGQHCEGPNEEYSTCKKSCPPETCISVIAFYNCDSHEPCAKGCVCKPGYLRKELGEPCMPSRYCLELANSPDFN